FADERDDLGVDGRAAPGGPPGKRGPVRAKAAPVPTQPGVGSNDDEGPLQPDHLRDIQIQNHRSLLRSLGRVAVRLYTASCWRKARFSRARERWPSQRNGRSRTRWSKVVIIGVRFCPEQS